MSRRRDRRATPPVTAEHDPAPMRSGFAGFVCGLCGIRTAIRTRRTAGGVEFRWEHAPELESYERSLLT